MKRKVVVIVGYIMLIILLFAQMDIFQA
jgi:hypothetical protein